MPDPECDFNLEDEQRSAVSIKDLFDAEPDREDYSVELEDMAPELPNAEEL